MDVIDADWIKRHLANRHGELKELADAVGLSPDKITKIIKGERQIKSHEAPRIAAFFRREEPGMADPEAAFQHQAAPVNLSGTVQTVAAALCPGLHKPEAYRVRHAAPGAGLLIGDLLVVELGMTADPGDLVIATIADTDRDIETTLIRRYWPPLIVPIAQDDPYPAMPASADQTAAIVASVKAIARGGVAG